MKFTWTVHLIPTIYFWAKDNQAERRFDRIIGNSAALESVLDQVEQVAHTNSTVLIEGETRTGKELIAHAIHNAASASDAHL